MELSRFPHYPWIFTFNFNNLKLFKNSFMKKTMSNKNFFKQPLTVATIGIISLIGGFYFLSNKITGNVILKNDVTFSLLPLIGLLLIACSAILIIYSIKKR